MSRLIVLGTHAQRLERWLGRETVEELSHLMKDWYGPPVAVGGVPGKVFVHRGGDFRGPILTGHAASALCAAESFLRRVRRGVRLASYRAPNQLNMGFASLSDLIAEATAGKRREFLFNKAGSTGVVGVTNSLILVGTQPPAAATAPAAPGGIADVDSDTGFFTFVNPTSPDTQHFVSGFPIASVAGNTLLLFDCIFRVAKTVTSTAAEAVTGVPTRYQNTTPGSVDSAEGNFLFIQVGLTALSATSHNHTVVRYTNQAGETGRTLPTVTGVASAIVHRHDGPAGFWFEPLASGDTGIKALTQMQLSAALSAGVINYVMGHPIAWMPCPIVNLACIADGINTAFNLVRIFDDAALAFLEVTKPSTTATTYTGTFTTVAG